MSCVLVPVARLRLEMAEAFVVDSSEDELDDDDDDEDDDDEEPAPDAEDEEDELEEDEEEELEEELSESLSEPSAPATGGFFSLIDALTRSASFVQTAYSVVLGSSSLDGASLEPSPAA